MEALERFIKVPEVSNPKLIVIVGSMGLTSNIIGLCLFQGHGHPHAGLGHDHGHDHGHSHSHDIENHGAHEHGHGDEESEEQRLQNNINEIVGHPARARAFIMDKAHSLGYDLPKNGEQQALLRGKRANQYGTTSTSEQSSDGAPNTSLSQERHAAAAIRRHRQATGSLGHSHENMNMTGVFLHVLGDAVGNMGVISTGLFIWYTDYTWRFYVDPLISFVIACIIFHSALPLVKSASFILLQGVPASVSLEGVRDSVLRVDGVLGLHDLHVWQLNENKIVASLHMLVDCSGEQTTRYMEIANQVRRILHLWGIHSSTIQPEFVTGIKEAARLSGVELDPKTDKNGRFRTRDGNFVENEISQREQACLLACDGECRDATCCELAAPSTSGKDHREQHQDGSNEPGHYHGEDHNH